MVLHYIYTDPSVEISSSTSRKLFTLEEASTVWEGVFVNQKEESTSNEARPYLTLQIIRGNGRQ